MTQSRAAVHPSRVRAIAERPFGPGPVVYWMSREQRADDNWALLYAQQQALEHRRPLVVVFCLVDRFLGATPRHYAFMLQGLRETADRLQALQIPFVLVQGDPEIAVPRMVRRLRAALLVSDFDPLRVKQRWRATVAREVSVPVHEVDAHNIVPCRVVSDQREYGAYTLRPKLMKLLPDYLTEMPRMVPHPYRWSMQDAYRERRAHSPLRSSLHPLVSLPAGTAAGMRRLRQFIVRKLARYPETRNDPVRDGQSGLSPYLHFGQIAAQRVAVEVRKADAPLPARDAFLEQLIVRRELADNFCLHTPNYDSLDSAPTWARETLQRHARDPREYRYTLRQWENAETHDPLWNAAQRQMVVCGTMHGYLRMYWAKKILEWSRDPADAYRIAVYLNDRYEFDGRDPNGYAGIAWAIAGVHDRPWLERPVFGTVRYMSAAGAARKFDVAAYVRKVSRL